MAEIKIMTLAAQQHYDEKIKAFIASEDEKLVNGVIKTNTDAIAAINDENTGILKQAKDYANGKDVAITAAHDAADKAQADATANAQAIEQINHEETGILAQAKAFASEEDVKVQGAVDALSDKVGTVPEGSTVMGIITNIQENAYDDTALVEKIDGVDGKVTTLVGEDTNKSVRTIANEELAKQLVAEGAKESLDTLAEIAAWIQNHPDDASAMNKAIGNLEALVGTLPDGITATTVIGYVQEVVAAEKARAEGVEAGLEGRLATVEGNIGDGTVDSRIATAKEEAAADSTAKADGALTNANAYTDEKVAANKTLIDANTEAIAGLHTVANSGSWSDLTDKPFGAEVVEIVPETTMLLSEEGATEYNDREVSLVDGDTYIVVWDGEEHTCVAANSALGDYDGTYPFYMDVFENILYLHGSGEHTFSISHVGTKTLDEKFIPSTIARVSDQTVLADRLTVLEAKIGDGFSEITNEEIDAMFA